LASSLETSVAVASLLFSTLFGRFLICSVFFRFVSVFAQRLSWPPIRFQTRVKCYIYR